MGSYSSPLVFAFPCGKQQKEWFGGPIIFWTCLNKHALACANGRCRRLSVQGAKKIFFVCGQPTTWLKKMMNISSRICSMTRRDFSGTQNTPTAKTRLENILPRGSRDRDPRYPKGVPWDQNFFLKKFLLKSYLGICRQVWGLLWVKSDFWPNNGYLQL